MLLYAYIVITVDVLYVIILYMHSTRLFLVYKEKPHADPICRKNMGTVQSFSFEQTKDSFNLVNGYWPSVSS